MTRRQRVAEMAEAIDQAELNEDTEEDRPYARAPAAKSPSQVYSVRIPVDRLEQLRNLAHERGLQPTALIRRWVLERLDGEARLAAHPTVVVVHAVGRSKVTDLKGELRSVEEEIVSSLAANSVLTPGRTER